MAGKVLKDEGMAEQNSSIHTLTLLLFSFVFIALFGFAYYQLSKDDRLPITRVNVSGSFDNIKPQALGQIINQDIQGNFFTLDVERLHTRLVSLEWANQVWIHRVWPGTLNIDLKEHVPVALVVEKGLLNSEGEIFTRNIGAHAKQLPRFLVTERYYKQALDAYHQLAMYLKSYELEIKEFVFDERKSQSVRLKNGIQIVLGRHDTGKRFERFIRSFAHEVQHRKDQIKRIDLRYTNGFAVSDNSLRGETDVKEVFWT